MHQTAILHARLFIETYLADRVPGKIVEIGSQDINGSLRQVAPNGWVYTGVDFAAGPGVDVVLHDPYRLPFADGSVDVVLSSSCYEHAEFFWLSFLEVIRVLKPAGLFYLNVPSNGNFHRYPVDCWRFYPDSGGALANWAQRNGYPALLLEGFTGLTDPDGWSDRVQVFLKDAAELPSYQHRIQDKFAHYSNGLTNRDERLSNPQWALTERSTPLARLRSFVTRLLQWRYGSAR
jgi:SAM-dependent methyltransferase